MAALDRNPMIEEPAFFVITLLNGTTIRGRCVRYSDPESFERYGVFRATDSEGATTYALWDTIAFLQVWPGNVTPPETPS